MQSLHLSKLHVFPYSLRKGTAAERFPGRVPDEVKAVRAAELIALSAADEAAFAREWSKRPREVLLEETVKVGNEIFYKGYTREYVEEKIPADGHISGEVVKLG